MLPNGPLSARVAGHCGKPVFWINGQPAAPILYALTDTPGGRWTWEELPRRNLRNFAQAGFNLFQVDLWLEDIWEKGKPLNIELAQRQLRGVLDVHASAGILLRLHINAPFWWNEEHPGECTEYVDGPSKPHEPDIGVHRHIIGDLDRRSLHSLASELWKEQTAEILAEFCERLSQTEEGNRLIGIQFCDGVSHEWHYWAFIDHEPDCGPAMTARFRRWLAARYADDDALRSAWGDPAVSLAAAGVPGMPWRKNWSREVFHSLPGDRRIVDYFMCQQETVAEDITFFAQVLKRNWPRPLIVGVFYGYYFFLFSRQAVGGHLCIETVLDCPEIDFLSAPFSYHGKSRPAGGTGQSRGIVEACELRGKLWMTEQDQETSVKHIAAVRNCSIWDCDAVRRFHREDMPSDIAILRRNALQAITKHGGMWYYDFGPNFSTGWWDYPDHLKEIARLKAFADERLSHPTDHAQMADVLVVYDTSSFYYVVQGKSPVSGWADDFSAAMYRCGVLFDNAYLCDIDKMDLARYSMVIFVNCWAMTAEARSVIKDSVCSGRRHVLFFYAAGAIDDRGFSFDNTRELLGMDIALAEEGEYLPHSVPGLMEREGGDFRILYSAEPILDEQLLRTLLKRAGAHVYVESDDVVFGGEGLLVLHTARQGSHRLTLRDNTVLELTTQGPYTAICDVEKKEWLQL